MNGKPIPPEDLHKIPYSLTDQGREDQAPEIYGTGATVTRDEGLDADLEAFEQQLWMSKDPLTEVMDEYKEKMPGNAFRFLADPIVQRRGMRGFVAVKNDNGDPVTVGGLTLARMPERHARIRDEHYRREHADQLESAMEQYNEATERIAAAAGEGGAQFEALRSGSSVQDSRDSDASASIGLSRTRGNRAI